MFHLLIHNPFPKHNTSPIVQGAVAIGLDGRLSRESISSLPPFSSKSLAVSPLDLVYEFQLLVHVAMDSALPA